MVIADAQGAIPASGNQVFYLSVNGPHPLDIAIRQFRADRLQLLAFPCTALAVHISHLLRQGFLHPSSAELFHAFHGIVVEYHKARNSVSNACRRDFYCILIIVHIRYYILEIPPPLSYCRYFS